MQQNPMMILQQFLRMGNNPNQLIQMMLQSNPNLAPIANQMFQSGMSPEQFVMQLARQNNMDPNAARNMMQNMRGILPR